MSSESIVKNHHLFLLLWVHALSLLADNDIGEPLVVLDSSLSTTGLYSVMALLLGDHWSLLLHFTGTSQRTMHTAYDLFFHHQSLHMILLIINIVSSF